MKRFVALTFLIAVFSQAFAQESNNYPFQDGEKMNFVLNVEWENFISVNLVLLVRSGTIQKIVLTLMENIFVSIMMIAEMILRCGNLINLS